MNLSVKVHPVVLFQIVDAFERRNADSKRVIGTLLGKIMKIKNAEREKLKKFSNFSGTVEKGVVEVTNCFCVPHKEHDDQVEAEITYGADVFDLNRRVNSSESIVGKFSLDLKSENF